MTPQQHNTIKQVSLALYDTVEASGTSGAPAGLLYAACMNLLTLEQFEAIMGALVKIGRVRKQGHVYYVGGQS